MRSQIHRRTHRRGKNNRTILPESTIGALFYQTDTRCTWHIHTTAVNSGRVDSTPPNTRGQRKHTRQFFFREARGYSRVFSDMCWAGTRVPALQPGTRVLGRCEVWKRERCTALIFERFSYRFCSNYCPGNVSTGRLLIVAILEVSRAKHRISLVPASTRAFCKKGIYDTCLLVL